MSNNKKPQKPSLPDNLKLKKAPAAEKGHKFSEPINESKNKPIQLKPPITDVPPKPKPKK